MKKLIILLVAVCLIVCLYGCSSSNQNQSQPSANQSQAQTKSTVKSSKPSVNPNPSYASTEKSSPNNNFSTNDSKTSNVETSAPQSSSSNGNQSPNQTLNFAQRTDALLDGATINDQAFLNYYKGLGEYNPSATVSSNAIYASPNGNGNGTKNSPYSLQEALDSVSAGQTIYLLGGTYDSGNADGYYVETKGNANGYITIRNYPGETAVITNKNTSGESYGFQIGHGCCYTVIEGIEISNITAYNAYGIAVWGNNQNHLIFRNLNIHHIKTNASNPETETNSSANAILISGENKNPVSNVIIASNNMSNNVTGWAETCSVTANCEYVYILENTVSDNTNIGIDFYGNAGYCSTASLDQPRYGVAAGNIIKNSYCAYADCAGLYCDGARDIIFQFNRIENCQFGIEIGSEERQDSYPVINILVRNNLVVNNKVVGMRVGGYETSSTGYVKNTEFINNTLVNNCTNSDGGEIVIAKVDGIKFINNLVKNDNNAPFVKTDFTKTYCKNLTFTNNCFNNANQNENDYEFYMFNSSQTGVNAFNSALSATTITGKVSLNSSFLPTDDSCVINSAVSANYGLYDYNLKARTINSKADVGAIEKQ